jgi:NAD+ kinase
MLRAQGDKVPGNAGDQMARRIHFAASTAPAAAEALAHLTAEHGQVGVAEAEVVVALGGDGFMLQTLHEMQPHGLPVYGMNCGTIGFLMNTYFAEGLSERLDEAEEAVIHPLFMRAETADGGVVEALAINEVSLLRAGAQAAKLRISVDGKIRMEELVCDGALVATPAGSTAYNYSAHGPILPIGADVLTLTAMAAFRPRRWRGALLPARAVVRIDVLEPEKRPVRADSDSRSVPSVLSVEVRSEPGVRHRILFDPGHGLEERLLNEQFA